MNKKNFGLWYLGFAVLFFGANIAIAHDYHYHESTTIRETISPEPKGIALGIASGQHHYKATSALQWSIGAGYVNDDSAVSFGLGLQAGKVFTSCNFSSDGDASAIGCGASGTF